MKLTAAGIALIKSFEACELTAYRDVAGVLTIGWGHTGPELRWGMTITQDQADGWFDADVEIRDAEVQKLCPSSVDSQHSAMVSLAYNIGIGNFQGSSVCRFHNLGQFENAADSFSLWCRSGNQISPGLVRRRAAEADMYRGNAGGQL